MFQVCTDMDGSIWIKLSILYRWAFSQVAPRLRCGGYLPCGNDSPLWMIVAAKSVRLPVRSGLHDHPFRSWLPDAKSPADAISWWGAAPFQGNVSEVTLSLKYSPVVRDNSQVQPVWRKLYGGDLVLPIIIIVVTTDKGKQTMSGVFSFGRFQQ